MVKISACVITKNEEKNIERWLNCVKQIASEIVVVDTGSTDRTVELAEKGGARVERFAWINDFAAAKNYALDKCHGDWIIFLDADEYFTAASIDKVKISIRDFDKNKNIIGIVCRLINIDADQHNRYKGAVVQIRIFRKLTDLRFVRKIHERLQDFTNSGREMRFVKDIEIYHTGYSSKILEEKLKRNKVIIDKEYEETTDEKKRQNLSAYLLDCCYGLGDYEGAIKHAQEVIDSNIKIVGKENSPYVIMVSAMNKLNKPQADVQKVLHEAEKKYPKSVDFILMEGFSYWKEKDYFKAEACLKRAELLSEQEKNEEFSLDDAMSDNSLAFWPNAYRILGMLSGMRFEKDKAVDYFLKGLKVFPYDNFLLAALLREFIGLPPEELIQLLNSFFDKKQDADYLLSVLSRIKGMEKVYLYYAQFAAERDKLTDFTMAGRYDAAVAETAERVERLSNLGIWSAETMKLPAKRELSVLLPFEYRQKWYEKAGLPLVSIMIPTYNRPEMFEETLKSALSQTYENFEVIVCDNSTDERTAEVVKKYLSDERLRYYRNSSAKTKEENFLPFEYLANGEYLQWCMDDDILLPDKLKKMIAAFKQHPEVTLVTSQRRVIDEKGKTVKEHYAELDIVNELAVFPGEDAGRTLFTSFCNYIGEPSAVLFRRKDLQNHYWRADCRGYKTISDIAMWLELLEKGELIVFRDALSCYRKHEQQEGGQPDVVMLSRIEWVNLVDEYYVKKLFVHNVEDYKMVLNNFWQEYKTAVIPEDYGSKEMHARYVECMENIGKIING